MVNEVASIGTVQGPQEIVTERTPKSGDSDALMCPRSILPYVRYSTYGTWIVSASTGTNCVAKGRSQVSTPTLRSEVEEIRVQLTATSAPLTTRIEQTSQSVQQSAAIAGQALEHARTA